MRSLIEDAFLFLVTLVQILNSMKILMSITFACLFLGSCAAQSGITLSKNTDGSTTLLQNDSEKTSMYISKNGNLGIGKKNPTDKLEVNGQIHARSVKVDLEKWADTVFEKEYDLLRLSEIEAYILQYGHLPEIPSAKKVLKEGIELGEMNRLLLQKVEELTLHLIEKEKQIDQLAESVQDLKKEVNTLKTNN